MKILFLVPYPLQQAPSQRFRFEQYFSFLTERGHTFEVRSFSDPAGWQAMASKGRMFPKFFTLVKGFLDRFLTLFRVPSAGMVFIHREATPLGPPWVEWTIAKVFKKKIVYDFDDAIWTTDRTDESFLFKKMKWRSKVRSTCRWSYKVSCGNEYLRSYAAQFNSHAVLNPTTLETEHWHNPALQVARKNESNVVIGWTGSYTTLKYLEEIESVLGRLQKEFPLVSFLVIADKKPDLNLPRLNFVPWKESTEVQDLLEIDIGVMPLPDDEWSKGKCGFKALQYMALEIPAVVSPVGVNTRLIEDGVNGFLASSPDEWYQRLSMLVRDKALRQALGKKGRLKVNNGYSVLSNKSTFLALFE